MSDTRTFNSPVALPLIAAQPGIWMAEQLMEKANGFTVAHYVEFYGTPDRSLFDRAIRAGLASGDMIHARFDENDRGELVQYLPQSVTPDRVIAPEWFDFSQQSDGAECARVLMHDDITEPLSARGPRALYRQIVVQIEPGRWFWYQRFHHLILDGFSFTALTAHIVAIYQALRAEQTPPLSPFTSFVPVVQEYLSWTSSQDFENSKRFWQNHAADLPAPITLAQPELMPDTTQRHTLYQTCSLDNIELQTLCADGGREPGEWLMAGICLWLYRMSGEPRISVGFPFMRRMGSAALTALGPVVNVLPLQLSFSKQISAHDVVEMLLKEIKTVRRHQCYEAEQLRRDLGLVGGEGALYGPVINYKIYHDELIIDGHATITHTMAMGPIDDLEIEIGVHRGRLNLTLVANPARYTRDTLVQYGKQIQHLLLQMVANPDVPVGDFSMVTPEEQQQIETWASGAYIMPPLGDVSVLDWLRRRVLSTPDDSAVVSGVTQLSYRQFQERVMQLARLLIDSGIGAEDVVALGLARSEQAVVAIFAVLASGGAYLPLDMDYPAERLALMCEDARPKVILACAATLDKMPDGFAILNLDAPEIMALCEAQPTPPVVDTERREPLQGDHLAYMIYTSGSTGRPKGVMVTHKGLLNLLVSHARLLFGPAIVSFGERYQRRMRAGHTASFSFDSSWEPLFCMLMGAEVMIFDEELRRDAWALVQQMRVTPIDIMDVTPSFLSQMIDSGLLEQGQPAPYLLMIGGEAATPRLWETLRAHPHIKFYNYYGPSEYTVDTLGAAVAEADEPIIGRPVANTEVWLLDDRLQPVPVDVAGELYISGAGIARGYLRRPDLTAARFVANPFREGEVMYRTGDLMRWRPDGQLAFIGRVDHQIKVRGFRVELGEVENALVNVPQVSSAVVIAEPVAATWRLIGFCAIPDAATRERADIVTYLKNMLGQQLPDYMVPGVIVVMEALPLMINGKVDRQSLPAVAEMVRPVGRSPATPAEQLISAAITQVLGLTTVAADDDFFALGGDSISAMSLGNQLRRAGWQLRPKEIFAGRTPAAMARLMNRIHTKQESETSQRYGVIEHLPILRWYVEQGQHDFAQGMFIQIPETFSPEILPQVMRRLVEAHPALGGRLEMGQLIVSEAQDSAAQCQVITLVGSEEEGAEHAFSQAIVQLNPRAGKLWQATLLLNGIRPCGLVLVIHHLVTDGVSWRILLESLPAAADAVARQEPAISGENSTLYDWSQWLNAHLPQVKAELPFWTRMLDTPCALPLARKLSPERDTEPVREEIRTLLTPEQSVALLELLPGAYRTGTDVLLLAALLIASGKIWRQDRLRVSLESHGRPSKRDDIELSRTVGWLTAEYPVCLHLNGDAQPLPLKAVRSVKAVLDAIPDNGIGYGLLRYLGNERALMELAERHAPEILFNYLGRFATGQIGDWCPRSTATTFRDTLAVYTSPQMPISHPLEINIFAGQGPKDQPQLAVHWGYTRELFTDQEIHLLGQSLSDAVDMLCDFARAEPCLAADTLTAAQTGTTLDDMDMDSLRHRYGVLGEVLPLLPLQQGLLFHVRTTQNVASYNSLTQLTLNGALDQARLQEALNHLVVRYPQLAAWFDSDSAAQPVQILPLDGDARLHWPLTCVSLRSDDDEVTALARLEHQEIERPLFSSSGPMLHALLVKHHQPQRYTLFLTAHHLVVDGWSTPLLLQDLMALLQDAALNLPRPPISYGTLIHRLSERDATVSRELWREQMRDASPLLLFGEQNSSGAVSTLTRELMPELEQALNAFCRQNGLTLNTVMQGIWALVLAVSSGSEDVVFGSPVSGRMADTDALEKQVGLFSNTLPVRLRFDMSQPLIVQLQALQQRQIMLLEHDNLGLAEIQRLAGTGALFDTLLVVENYPDPRVGGQPERFIECVDVNNRGYTHYPVTLLVLPGKRLTLHLEFRPQVSNPSAILNRFILFLEQLLADPLRPILAWRLITEREQAFIDDINQTKHEVTPETLYGAISRQRAIMPQAIALRDATHSLTWHQMHEQVCALAAQLQQAGVGSGDVVAVALPRSVRLSLALQAIVALGAAWLPLDVGYPDERLYLMLDDAKPRLILVDSTQLARFKGYVACLSYDALADSIPAVTLPAVTPQHPAYVLYTSGSTGRPKGVVVDHQAIINRLRWMQASYPLMADDVVLQKTPCSFDVSVWEFFWPLMEGATLVMAPAEAHRDPQALIRLIEDYRITTLHFVPSMLAIWLDVLTTFDTTRGRCASLRQVFCSGEALSCQLAHRYEQLIAAPLHNLYGPTEAAVDVTWQPASGASLARVKGAGVPIGRPVWNTRLHILDRWLRPVPPGAPGELWLCGVQLAQGYYRRPDLTASRFVADPFGHGERMYRTGDIARWLEDGTVEYLGRTDDQLKIRGQRIELGEIEQALLNLPGVAQAAVEAREWVVNVSSGDNRQLVAWVIARDNLQLDPQALQLALAARLPAYMVPVRYVQVAQFPLSANGKLDRKALPLPQSGWHHGEMPRTDSERRVAGLFSELLGCEVVHADDDFFALGGHSLLAMRLAVELRRCFGRTVAIGQVMAARTVSQLAALIDGDVQLSEDESRGSGEVLPLRSGEGPALFCFHPASGFAWQYSGLLRYLPGDYPIIGLQSPRPDGVIAGSVDIDAACDRHLATLRRYQSQGPYYLLGYSLGGTLAHGVATRLMAMGERVSFLGLLDTWPSEGQDWSGPGEEQAKEEVAREQADFMADSLKENDPQLLAEKQAMFRTIVANYQDAVRLLSQARTAVYPATATLFMANLTLPEGMDPRKVWAPYVAGLDIYAQECEHANILAPSTLVKLGPLLNQLLEAARD